MGSQHVADFLGGSAEDIPALAVDVECAQRGVTQRVASVPESSLYKSGVADDSASWANFSQRFSFLGRLGTVRLVCVTRAKPLTLLNPRERCARNAFRNRRR